MSGFFAAGRGVGGDSISTGEVRERAGLSECSGGGTSMLTSWGEAVPMQILFCRVVSVMGVLCVVAAGRGDSAYYC